MLAYDYPILGLFFSMLFFFLWIVWIILLFRIIADIFRSDDLGGFAKALWLVFVILLPYLGVLVYVIARGGDMGRRDMERANVHEQAFRTYVKDAANTGGSADEVAKLADLKDRGIITDAEFNQQKAKLLG